MIKALLVDDEPHANAALNHLLNACDYVDVLGLCENGLQAVRAIHDTKPDVVFLDIQMPKLDGFDVLELLGDDAPLVVFVTAFDEYAVQAFERNAVDYLLKPVSEERLLKTLERVQSRLALNQVQIQQSAQKQVLAERQQLPLSRILIRDKGDVFVVPVADIIAIEAADDYVVICTDARNYIKQDRLTQLENQLSPQQFCRIHRSTIINLDYLEGIESDGKDSKLANLKGQRQYGISRTGYTKLVERM